MTAVLDKDVEGVKFFSKVNRSKINKVNIAGSTALNLAARGDNVEIISLLVRRGANVNIADNEGWTPLMKAARFGNYRAVKILLSRKSNSLKTNSLDESALIHAANSQCFKCFTSIFDRMKSNGGKNIFLSEQLSKSFIVTKNHENKEMQEFISAKIDELQHNPVQIKISTKRIFVDRNITKIPLVKKAKSPTVKLVSKPVAPIKKLAVKAESPVQEKLEKPKKKYLYKLTSSKKPSAAKGKFTIVGPAGSPKQGVATVVKAKDSGITFVFNAGKAGKVIKNKKQPSKNFNLKPKIKKSLNQKTQIINDGVDIRKAEKITIDEVAVKAKEKKHQVEKAKERARQLRSRALKLKRDREAKAEAEALKQKEAEKLKELAPEIVIPSIFKKLEIENLAKAETPKINQNL